MDFEPVIGFEIHAELKTRSKVFCGCRVEFGAPPNTNVCPVCLGMPGTLPVLNRRCVDLVLRTALAMNCEINERATFDRKNYYYPDLPKNYQISQQYAILGVRGGFEFALDGQVRRVRINNIHLEEDAGKNIHAESFGREEYSLVDLNRAGTGLMEIVTEPDLRSVEEAEAFMKAVKNLLQYLDVSDCKMQEGSLRFELNVSVRPKGSDQLSPAYVEVKNVASVKSVLAAAEYEIKRQSKVYREGGRVEKETRLWDDAARCTRPMRSKEAAKDYRYFPEPDLVPLEISPEWLEEIRTGIPELRDAKQQRLVEQYGIPPYDAGVLAEDRSVADYFEKCCQLGCAPKAASNWIMTEILRELKETDQEISALPIKPEHLAELLSLMDQGTISGKIAKEVYADMRQSGRMPKTIVEEKGLVQVSDASAIGQLVDQVLAENPKSVEDLKAGKDKAITHLMGQVMRLSKGKANPQSTREMILKRVRS